jgi:uncharacterized protein DUF4349
VCKILHAARRTGMPRLNLPARSVSRPTVVIALLLLSAACSTMYRGTPVPAPDAVPAGAVSSEMPISPDEARSPAGQAGVARLLIRRASMLLDDVKDPELVARRVTMVTASLHIKVRVPAATLEDAMDSVATLGHVEKRQISADDVTEQVVDLGARVATRRAIRDRLRALLERAASISEIITVERELARVQGELDVLERRLEYLRGSASMAELSVDARIKVRPGPITRVVMQTGRLLEKLFILR